MRVVWKSFLFSVKHCEDEVRFGKAWPARDKAKAKPGGHQADTKRRLQQKLCTCWILWPLYLKTTAKHSDLFDAQVVRSSTDHLHSKTAAVLQS